MIDRLVVRIGAEVKHLHPRINPRLRARRRVIHQDAVLHVDVHRLRRVEHQCRIRLPALDIVAAEQFFREVVQHVQLAERVLHFADRAVRDHADRHRHRIQQRVSAGDNFQLGVEEACDLGAVHRFQIRFHQIHPVLFVNDVDDLVQLHALKAFKHLFEIERNTKFLEHGDIRAGTNDLTVDQRTVTVEKYRFNSGHAFPF